MWRTERSEQKMLTDYLLGNLSEDQMAAVEDRAFADREYRAAVDAAEADLIDAWVSGELTDAGDRRKFEQRFLASPQRRNKVEFARTLAKLAQETGEANPRRAAFRWNWGFSFQLAGALALAICAVSTVVLMQENRSLRSQAQEARQRLIEAPSKKTPAAAAVATLTLLTGVTRSQGAESVLQLQGGEALARIAIQLEEMDDFPRFRAELRSKGGEQILTLPNLRSRKSAGGFTVILEVPASVFSEDRYELKLSGITESNSVRDVGYYDLRVKKN